MSYFGNKGFTSTSNSTTSVLDSTATYTGVAELNNFPDVMVQVETDLEGTLYCEFSPDGTNWDTSLSFNYIPTRINPPHVFVKGNRYFRVRFVNAETSTQSYLRLYTYYGSFQKLTAPINGTLAENYDAIVTRPTDYKYEVAMGKRQGRTLWNKFGYNLDIDTAAQETIWSVGGDLTRLTTASTLIVTSTSGLDTNGGTGANSIIIYGIDANRESLIEVVTMNGTSNVTTSNSFLGVNRAAIYLSGSGGVNAGNINITATTGGSTQAQIPASEGTTQQSIFFTQANHTALIDWMHINCRKLSGGSAPRVTIKGFVHSFVSGSTYEIFRDNIDTAIENNTDLRPSQPFVVGEKSVIWFTCSTDTNNTVVSLRFSLIEERNS